MFKVWVIWPENLTANLSLSSPSSFSAKSVVLNIGPFLAKKIKANPLTLILHHHKSRMHVIYRKFKQ